MADEKTCDERKGHGFRPSRLQKRRFTRAGDARDCARTRKTNWQGKLGTDLRETRRSNGSGETTLCQCGPLRRTGVLDVWLSARAEHAAVCCFARRWLVRARDRAARSQSANPAALTLHGPSIASVSKVDRPRVTVEYLCQTPNRVAPAFHR